MVNPLLLDDRVQDYLKLHEQTDLARFVFMGSPFVGIRVQELAQQLEGKLKAKDKLPRWYSLPKILFPPKINLEQTSSELTARYKASLIPAKTVADLTGGMGVDSFFFSEKAKDVTYFEQNIDLAHIAEHNFKQFHADNITVVKGDALAEIFTSEKRYDLIYADPSRRNDQKQKLLLLQDCEPNIPQNLPKLFEIAETIMVKVSPLLDISAALDQLQHVSEIHIVAVKNEVKELLFILSKAADKLSTKIITVNISNIDQVKKTNCSYVDALKAKADCSRPKTYLYEPNAALMKSGLFNWISSEYGVEKISVNSHLYTSDKQVNFPGRVFEIKNVLPYNKREIAKILGGKKANITVRNFRETVAQLRKKFKIKDGGERYIFFTTDAREQALVLACEKVE